MGGKVVRTEDIGNNRNVLSENLGWLYGGYFFDEVGWVVGSNEIIKKSINAGVTWFDQLSVTDKTLQAAHFLSKNIINFNLNNISIGYIKRKCGH